MGLTCSRGAPGLCITDGGETKQQTSTNIEISLIQNEVLQARLVEEKLLFNVEKYKDFEYSSFVLINEAFERLLKQTADMLEQLGSFGLEDTNGPEFNNEKLTVCQPTINQKKVKRASTVKVVQLLTPRPSNWANAQQSNGYYYQMDLLTLKDIAMLSQCSTVQRSHPPVRSILVTIKQWSLDGRLQFTSDGVVDPRF
jgi:hypothetical protein